MNSHPKHYWEVHPDIPDEAYIFNEVADALAGEGAAQHAVEPKRAQEFKDMVDETKQIIRRNLEVSRILVARVPDPSREVKPVKAATYIKRLRLALADTEHSVRRCRRRLWCAQCFGFSPQVGSKIPWLRLECQAGEAAHPQAGAPHPTHKVRTATVDGIVFCELCGFWGRTFYKRLLSPCPRAPATGAHAYRLSRLARGLEPLPDLDILGGAPTELVVIGLDDVESDWPKPPDVPADWASLMQRPTKHKQKRTAAKSSGSGSLFNMAGTPGEVVDLFSSSEAEAGPRTPQAGQSASSGVAASWAFEAPGVPCLPMEVGEEQPGQPPTIPSGSASQAKPWMLAEAARQHEMHKSIQILAACARGRGFAALHRSGWQFESQHTRCGLRPLGE